MLRPGTAGNTRSVGLPIGGLIVLGLMARGVWAKHLGDEFAVIGPGFAPNALPLRLGWLGGILHGVALDSMPTGTPNFPEWVKFYV
jgi:hypothetical protein